MKTFPVLMHWDDRRRFPDCPRAVPWELVAPHERQAQLNHGGQALARLAERGGLDPRELYAVVNDLPWTHVERMELVEAVEWLQAALAGAQDAGEREGKE